MALSPKQMKLLKALRDCFFVVSQACIKAGVDRKTYYNWLEDDEFKAEVEHIEQDYLNVVEDQLKTSSINNEAWAVKFTLERKHPAYKQKVETEVTDKRIKLDV